MKKKTQKDHIKPWSQTARRFICYMDIMGFKDLVMRSTHQEIYKLLNELYKKRKNIEYPMNLPTGYPIDSLKTISYSDSIIIFSKDDSFECFELLTFASSFLFAKAIEKGIPLKGACAYGEISINRSRQIFFGQPLIDAYLLQEEVAFYGIIFHNTIEKYFNNIPTNKKLIMYVDGLIPLKTGKINHIMLDWVNNLEGNDFKIKRSKALELMKKLREKTSGSPRKYIDNTVEIINKLKIITIG